MCEMMGLSFARPLSADFALREFARRSQENVDGWGLGWYPDQSLALVKEPVCWQVSQHARFLESYPGLHASLYIAHVRYKTIGGSPTHADTQPFRRELRGREYCFAHNGTLAAFRTLPLGQFHPVGASDSEHAFCCLLAAIARREQALADEASWRWLHGQLQALNELGTMNCLLADGERLFCYHDRGGHKGLSLLSVRRSDQPSPHFEDAERPFDGQPDNPGFVVASEPLSTGAWQRFQRAELVVLEHGLLRFSTHRSLITARRIDETNSLSPKADACLPEGSNRESTTTR